MENKKDEIVEKEKADNEWFAELALIAGLFGDWGKDAKYDELKKRVSKPETKK